MLRIKFLWLWVTVLAHMIHLFEVLVSVSVGITSMYRVLVLVVLRDSVRGPYPSRGLYVPCTCTCLTCQVSTNMTNFGRLAYVRLVLLFQPQEPQLHGCQFDFDIPHGHMYRYFKKKASSAFLNELIPEIVLFVIKYVD